MAWVEVTKQDVLDRLSNNELTRYERSGDDAPETDKTSGVIDQVVSRFRGAIQSCHNNTSFGPDCTIPGECVFHAVSLIKHAIVASIGSTDAIQGEERGTEYTDAVAYLRRVESCEAVISPHTGTTGDTTAVPPCYGSKAQHSFDIGQPLPTT